MRGLFLLILQCNLGLKMILGISFEYCYMEAMVVSAITLLYVPLLSAGAVVCESIMAVVIRLQGLRITAGSEDIRNFFTGLRIPDGGVHIIGGELEEAFIIFASDEDARRAMTRSGGCIKGSPVNLLLSSKSEMQSVLEESTRRSELKGRGIYKEGVKRPSAERGPMPFNKDPRADVRRPDLQEMRNRPSPSSFNEIRHQREAEVPERADLYLKLTGMPFSATKEDVYTFFSGIKVQLKMVIATFYIKFITRYSDFFLGIVRYNSQL